MLAYMRNSKFSQNSTHNSLILTSTLQQIWICYFYKTMIKFWFSLIDYVKFDI